MLWKHLHGRGEDSLRKKPSKTTQETPPRTWRRRSGPTASTDYLGNTSTDVEKTRSEDFRLGTIQKHLHGRGEDPTTAELIRSGEETPPRTWRRPIAQLDIRGRAGNTSTDVEKTSTAATPRSRSRKHLHGRGEDLITTLLRRTLLETPPRTWRRPSGHISARLIQRNTSTDVEKTLSIS